VVELPPGTDTKAVVDHARMRNLLLADLDEYMVGRRRSHRPAVVLGYADATLDELGRAVSALVEATL
jgi:DNA-binding transcriptional MocR family regulator